MVILHGDAGSMDELVVVVLAFILLWLAVRLSGRTADDVGAEAERPPDDPQRATEREGQRREPPIGDP